MEKKINKLLARQIKRYFGSAENIPEIFENFINEVNNTYESYSDDIVLLQNSTESNILKLWPRRMVRLDWNVHVRMMLI